MSKQICPHCGFCVSNEKLDVFQCPKCYRDSQNTLLERILSASWIARKENLTLDELRKAVKLDEDFLLLIYSFVSINNYSHQDFFDFLNKFRKIKEFRN
jgi:archaellum biogenesis ATPase FlaH